MAGTIFRSAKKLLEVFKEAAGTADTQDKLEAGLLAVYTEGYADGLDNGVKRDARKKSK